MALTDIFMQNTHCHVFAVIHANCKQKTFTVLNLIIFSYPDGGFSAESCPEGISSCILVKITLSMIACDSF